MECKSGLMARSTMETGLTTKPMVKEYLFIKTELDIKASGRMINKAGLEHKLGQMAQNILVNINKEKSTEKAL